MLIVICGEDIIQARAYHDELKKSYQKKNYSIEYIKPEQIKDIPNYLAQSYSLFSNKKVFFTENLNKIYSSRKNVKENVPLLSAIDYLDKSKDIDLIDWENGKSSWDLKLKKIGKVKEFKPSDNIFKLMENCFPGNLFNYLNLLNTVNKNQEEQFIFIMLIRHIRNLILAASGNIPSTIPFWQHKKIIAQSNLWSYDKLIKFYEALHRIDISIKTGTTSYSLKKSLDIVACYFL